MKFFKNIIAVCLLSLISVFLMSCTSELTLQLNKNGSVDIKFVGGAGEAFTQMILAASGGDEGAVFDVTEISYQLSKSGFSNVEVSSKKGTDIFVSMTDAKKTSYLFTSGIANVSGTKLSVKLDAKKLDSFYKSSDEVIQMVLDLLIAPVFNDEQSDENEYLENVASFYGDSAAKEIQFSNLKLNIINSDGSKMTEIIPLTKLLTLSVPMNIN